MQANSLLGKQKLTTNNKKQTQQEFLLNAMQQLGMTRKEFCERISVPKKTLDKWLASDDAVDKRAMPEMAWSYIREILENNQK